jgi:hypothetical protein
MLLLKVLGGYIIFWYLISTLLVFDPPKDIMESNQNGTQEPAKTQTTTTNLNVEFSETLLDNTTANIHHDNLTTEFHSNHNKEQDRRNDPEVYTGILHAMKSFKFLNCFFLIFLSLGLIYMITVNFKNYGITKIGDDQYITWVGSIATLVNGVTRPLWGYIYDKIGFKKMMAVMIGAEIVICATYCTFADNKIIFLLWNVFIFTFLGAHYVIFPPMVTEAFGLDLGAKILGYMYFSLSFTVFLNFLLLHFLQDLIGFSGIMWIEFAFAIICACLLYKLKVK